jgi:hypothetical protein
LARRSVQLKRDEREVMKTTLTKEDREKLLAALREIGLVLPAQGQIIINMSPQGAISAVECRISIR